MDHPSPSPETPVAGAAQSASTPPQLPPAGSGYPPAPIHHKTPALAAILSFCVPGLGNIYNGLYLRGFTFFFIQVTLFALAVTSGDEPDIAFLVPSLAFFWFFNVFDSYRQATLINYGGVEEPPRPQSGSALPAALVPGVVIFGLGLYGVLREYFDFDFDWLFDHWPIVLLLIGGGLVAHALWNMKKSAEAERESFPDPLESED